MKATEISDVAVFKAHCDWVVEQAKMVKALLNYNSEEMVAANKTRALSAIDTMMDSLRELKGYVEEVAEKTTVERSLEEKLVDATAAAKEANQRKEIIEQEYGKE